MSGVHCFTDIWQQIIDKRLISDINGFQLILIYVVVELTNYRIKIATSCWEKGGEKNWHVVSPPLAPPGDGGVCRRAQAVLHLRRGGLQGGARVHRRLHLPVHEGQGPERVSGRGDVLQADQRLGLRRPPGGGVVAGVQEGSVWLGRWAVKPQCGACFNRFCMILLFFFVPLFSVFMNLMALRPRIQNNSFFFFFFFFLIPNTVMLYNTNFVGRKKWQSWWTSPPVVTQTWTRNSITGTSSLLPSCHWPLSFFSSSCFYVHDNPLNPIKNRSQRIFSLLLFFFPVHPLCELDLKELNSVGWSLISPCSWHPPPPIESSLNQSAVRPEVGKSGRGLSLWSHV